MEQISLGQTNEVSNPYERFLLKTGKSTMRFKCRSDKAVRYSVCLTNCDITFHCVISTICFFDTLLDLSTCHTNPSVLELTTRHRFREILLKQEIGISFNSASLFGSFVATNNWLMISIRVADWKKEKSDNCNWISCSCNEILKYI